MRLVTVIFFLLLHISLFSQKKLKWGKIPTEDLAMTVYEKDTTAAAVVLNKRGDLVFNYTNGKPKYQLEIHKRIKILKRAGFDQGNISIPYYSYRNRGKISSLKVQVISPDGTKIELNSKEIFDNQVNDYYSEKRFAVPNLEVGSIIEYKYVEYKESIFSLRRWYFQESIPLKSSHYRLKVPEWFKYVKLTTGGGIESDPIEFVTEAIVWSGGGTRGGSGVIPVRVDAMHYFAEDMPAMKKEAYITTMDDYRAHIEFQLSSIEYPRTPTRQVLTTWEKVASELLKNDDYSGKIGNASLKEARAILEKKETEEEKIVAAYNYVQRNIKWNSSYGMRSKESLSEAFEKNIGNSADINLSIYTILKDAGLDVYPLIISTRKHGKHVEIYPILKQFNHVMVYVKREAGNMILDGTDQYIPAGIPSRNSLNKRGFLVEKDNPHWINIDAPTSSDTYLATVALDEEGTLKGSIAVSRSGYSAYNERKKVAGDKAGEFWKKRMTEKFPDIELSNITFDGLGVYDKKMKTKIDCEIIEAAQINGDFIYFSPWIYGGYDEQPFKLEKRSYPVEIPHPDKEQFILNLTIPKGYAIEATPESMKMILPNGGGKFQYLVTVKENAIQIVSKISITQLIYSSDEYFFIKEFFEKIIEKQGEQIVLKKVAD